MKLRSGKLTVNGINASKSVLLRKGRSKRPLPPLEDKCEVGVRGAKRKCLTGSGSNQLTEASTFGTSISGAWSQGDFLSKNPFSILPVEMWYEIFQSGLGRSDLQGVVNSNLHWRSLLFSERVQLLFPEVLQILMDKVSPSWPKENQLTLKDLLNVRNACTSWNKYFLDYLQNHPFHLEIATFIEDQVFNLDLQENGLHLQKTFDVTWFREYAEKMESSPGYFKGTTIPISRHIKITDKPPTVANNDIPALANNIRNVLHVMDLFPAVFRLFRFHGRGIWHMSLSLECVPIQILYTTLRIMLLYLPNLKSLKIQFSMELALQQFERRHWNDANYREQLLRDICRGIESEPLLTRDVKNLILLDLENIPAPIVSHLVSNCRNLEKLRVNYICPELDNSLMAFECKTTPNETLGSLSELLIRIRTLKEWQKWERFQFGAGSPIKKFFLNFSVETDLVAEEAQDQTQGRDRCINWQRIFTNVAKRFGKTLTDLKLVLPKATRQEDKLIIFNGCHTYRLKLPNLRTLRVFLPNLSSLDFLISLKETLENLHVIVQYDYSQQEQAFKVNSKSSYKKKEVIKFNGYFDHMLQSNIWIKLSKLSVLQVDILRAGKNPRQSSSYVRFCYNRPEES